MIHMNELWTAMPKDVQKKISCHDLKRIVDNYNAALSPIPEHDTDLAQAVLEGEQELHHDELGWWAAELDFWRCKFLKEHPELDNWEYVQNARKNEEGRGAS